MAELHEIHSGARWRVYSSKAPDVSKAGLPGMTRVTASLDDPNADTFVVFPALVADELEVEKILSGRRPWGLIGPIALLRSAEVMRTALPRPQGQVRLRSALEGSLSLSVASTTCARTNPSHPISGV